MTPSLTFNRAAFSHILTSAGRPDLANDEVMHVMAAHVEQFGDAYTQAAAARGQTVTEAYPWLSAK